MILPNWSAANEAAAAPLLDFWADQYGLERAVVYGLVALESQFNPRAYRAEPKIGDASYGLTQILTKTAAGLGYTGAPEGLYDRATNIQLGLEYLDKMLDRFGTMERALAAYNGGLINGEIRNPMYVDAVLWRAAYFQQKWEHEAAGEPAPTMAVPDEDGATSDTVLVLMGGATLALIGHFLATNEH